jgi:hypothetical protein
MQKGPAANHPLEEGLSVGNQTRRGAFARGEIIGMSGRSYISAKGWKDPRKRKPVKDFRRTLPMGRVSTKGCKLRGCVRSGRGCKAAKVRKHPRKLYAIQKGNAGAPARNYKRPAGR